MKIHILHTFVGFLLFAMWAGTVTSCSDDELVQGSYQIKDGIPVTASLKFGVLESEIMTRTAATDEVENSVTDLFVIAFNASGRISSYRIENGENVLGGIYYGTDQMAGGQSGTISNFTMYSGANQTIYAIANIDSEYTDLSQEDLSAFNGSEDEFLDWACTLSEHYSTWVDRGIFIMSGELEDVAIDENGTILNPSDAEIPLSRLEARITFKIKIDNSQHADLRFTPLYYRVHQISQGSYLFPKTKGDDEENLWDYTQPGYQSMSVSEAKNFDATDDKSLAGFLEFYIWENRQVPLKRISASSEDAEMKQDIEETKIEETNNLYALREKRDKGDAVSDVNKPGQEYEADDFRYANAHSTYVELIGNLFYTENGEEVSADVTYYVHLGSTGNQFTNEWYNDEDLVNNYDTKRNTHYIYNITLAGVESIRVEVFEEEGNKEMRPGFEGDVTVTQVNKTFDAHYGRTSFTLNKADILNGLSWSINTPFQNGTKEFNAESFKIGDRIGTEDELKSVAALQTTIELNDYRWMQFVINSEAIKSDGSPVGNDEYAKYPGYKAYSETDLDAMASPFGNTGWHYEGATAYYSKDVPMYDINQLLNHLYIEAKKEDDETTNSIFDTEGNVTITAFIDEYIYIYDPTTTFYRLPVSTTEENLTLWKKVVNGQNRTLSISYGVNKVYSPDGNSSWQKASVTFTQMPIRTFYNPDMVDTAWGTESIVEGKEGEDDSELLPTFPAPSKLVQANTLGNWGDNSYNNSSMDNGRENTITIIPDEGNLQWSHVLNMETVNWGSLRTGYQNIWYACLGRNRDLNGDDIVQEYEIRWYLASIDQLTDLWIGEEALPDMAKLYDVSKVTESNVPNRHVASSSVYDAAEINDENEVGNVWMIWAEEGASRGDVNRSYSSNDTGKKYDYRCVRNLGISLANIGTTPQDYVVLSTGTYNGNREYRIDVSRLNVNTLRSASPNLLLGSHTERSNTNRPARQFAILLDNPIRIGNDWNSIVAESIQDRICPSGYRLPNQRELLLLTMYFGPEHAEGYDDLFPYGDGGYNYDGRRFYVARTEFGFNNQYGGSRPGFSFERVLTNARVDTYAFNLINGWTQTYYYARCVRDVY